MISETAVDFKLSLSLIIYHILYMSKLNLKHSEAKKRILNSPSLKSTITRPELPNLSHQGSSNTLKPNLFKNFEENSLNGLEMS